MNVLSLNRVYNYGMMNGIARRPFSELGDQQLLEQTRRLAANQRCLEVHILDHLDEIDRRGLALRRGFSSLFDYTGIAYICRCDNGLRVTPISRYCFRNPLVVLDSLRSIAEPRAELVIVTVDGAELAGVHYTDAKRTITFASRGAARTWQRQCSMTSSTRASEKVATLTASNAVRASLTAQPTAPSSTSIRNPGLRRRHSSARSLAR